MEINKIREILETDGESYTDKQLLLIYNFLNEMAELSVSQYLRTKEINEK